MGDAQSETIRLEFAVQTFTDFQASLEEREPFLGHLNHRTRTRVATIVAIVVFDDEVAEVTDFDTSFEAQSVRHM